MNDILSLNSVFASILPYYCIVPLNAVYNNDVMRWGVGWDCVDYCVAKLLSRGLLVQGVGAFSNIALPSEMFVENL
jgi:hypothetical protein